MNATPSRTTRMIAIVCYALLFVSNKSECSPVDTTTDVSEVVCGDHQFQCISDGTCISKEWLCDKSIECHDSSDEVNCEKDLLETTTTIDAPACEGDQFRCLSDGGCIPKKWVCDSAIDCLDSSDEKNCGKTDCGPEEIRCGATGHCIKPEWICDGETDCIDNTDEQNCPELKKTTTTKLIQTTTTTISDLNLMELIKNYNILPEFSFNGHEINLNESSFMNNSSMNIEDFLLKQTSSLPESSSNLVNNSSKFESEILNVSSTFIMPEDDEWTTETTTYSTELDTSTDVSGFNISNFYDISEEFLIVNNSNLFPNLSFANASVQVLPEYKLSSSEFDVSNSSSGNDSYTPEIVPYTSTEISTLEPSTTELQTNTSLTGDNWSTTVSPEMTHSNILFTTKDATISPTAYTFTTISATNAHTITSKSTATILTSTTPSTTPSTTQITTTPSTTPSTTTVKTTPSTTPSTTTVRTTPSTTPPPCGIGYFYCRSNSECIPVEWRCDHTEDCWDGSDERNCDRVDCPEEMIQCEDTGQCIYRAWICDGQRDCDTGSDERYC